MYELRLRVRLHEIMSETCASGGCEHCVAVCVKYARAV